ncbi:SGNH/GDSL hydrolase family protein [Stenotrophomonas rhizophila]
MPNLPPRLALIAALLATHAPAYAHALENFGDANAAQALARLQPGSGQGQRLHLVQIGDSHTAGDYFTDRLRAQLQQRTGDGGIGWAMPMYASGQRLSRVGYDQQGFQLLSSRTSGEADYPFGGFVAMGTGSPTSLTIKSKDGGHPVQNVTVLVNQSAYDPELTLVDADGRSSTFSSPIVESAWSNTTLTAKLPFTLHTQGSPSTRIGGWWLSSGGPGAIVSAVGINGAELSQWSRWRPGWMQDLAAGKPDIVAIAYGTNEAFRSPLSAEQVRESLESAIDQLRQQLPGVGVLIIGAPESLKSTAGSCGQRAPSLDIVQEAQRAVARQRRTLYWDWQRAMGGACSMKPWINRGLARKDGVHFSKEGYELAADDLFQGMVSLEGKR